MELAVTLHILGVVWWIGGLAFVCTVVLPNLRRDPATALPRFQATERRFAPQVRVALLVVGGSGGWMLYKTGLWPLLLRFEPAMWWLHAMVCLWLIFVLMLFVLGPMGVLKRVMSGAAEGDGARRLARMHYLHIILLVFAVVTIVGAMTGSHGYA